MQFDLQTLLIAMWLMSAVFVGFSFLSWRTAQGHVEGPAWWLGGFSSLFVSFPLLAMRGHIPDWLSIFVANGLLALGNLLHAEGVMRFLGVRRRWWRQGIYTLYLLLVPILLWYEVFDPRVERRLLFTNLVYATSAASGGILLLRVADPRQVFHTRMAGSIFVMLSLLYGLRCFAALHWTGSAWSTAGSPFESFALFSLMVLLGGVAVAEAQLVNGRMRGALVDASHAMAMRNELLEQEVLRRTEAEAQLRGLFGELLNTQREIMLTLSEIVETRSKETARHVTRVGEYARVVALAAGAGPEEARLIAEAAPMHDIGKIGIPDGILHKPDRLTLAEMAVMMTHTTLGYEILRKSPRPLIRMAALIAREHHERWDGGGYPRGLRGEEISLAGRVVAIVDVFDALATARPYKAAWPLETILAYLREESGRRFDPRLVEVFFTRLPELLEISSRLQDVEAPAPEAAVVNL